MRNIFRIPQLRGNGRLLSMIIGGLLVSFILYFPVMYAVSSDVSEYVNEEVGFSVQMNGDTKVETQDAIIKIGKTDYSTGVLSVFNPDNKALRQIAYGFDFDCGNDCPPFKQVADGLIRHFFFLEDTPFFNQRNSLLSGYLTMMEGRTTLPYKGCSKEGFCVGALVIDADDGRYFMLINYSSNQHIAQGSTAASRLMKSFRLLTDGCKNDPSQCQKN